MAAVIEEAGLAPLDVFEIVQAFETCNEDNDPYATREFGAFEMQRQTRFWNLERYDSDLRYGLLDPTNFTKTQRALTILRAPEY